MFPDFLCIGAQKAGTSWLYYNLKKHPDLWLPPVKEIHYFDEKEYYQKRNKSSPTIFDRLFDNDAYNNWKRRIFTNRIKSGIKNGNIRDISWYYKYCFNPINDKWYASLYEPGRDKITGDITPEYSGLRKEAVAHIYEMMPNAKIIFIMRNPIQRAWSQVFMNLCREGKKIDNVSEEELLKRKELNDLGEKSRGHYLQIIKTWKAYYSEKQFFIGFIEEIAEFPEDFLRRLCNFLGIEAASNYLNKIKRGKVHSHGNKGDIPKNIAVYLARNYYDEIGNLSKCYGGYATDWLDYANELLE